MPGLFFYIWWSVVALVGAGMLLRVFLTASPSRRCRAASLFGFGGLLIGLQALTVTYTERHVGVEGVIFIPAGVMSFIFWVAIAMLAAGGLWWLALVKRGKKTSTPTDVVDQHHEPLLAK